jgi:hypothetical protein
VRECFSLSQQDAIRLVGFIFNHLKIAGSLSEFGISKFNFSHGTVIENRPAPLRNYNFIFLSQIKEGNVK